MDSGSSFRFIDAHAHLCTRRDPRELDHVAESGLLDQVWLLPIDVYAPRFEFDGSEAVLEIGKRYPGFFLPFGFIDYTAGPEQVDRMKDAGFVGLKAIRPPRDYDDPAYFPIYERAEALGMPILFHVGIISRRTREELTRPLPPGPKHMRPSMLDVIAAAFPKLRLIAGHQGIPWANELAESLFQYANISATVTGLVDYDWLIHHLDRRCGNGELFTDRLMIGTDSFYGLDEHFERVKRYFEFMRMFFEHVGRTYGWGGAFAEYAHDNAARLMREPVFPVR